MFSWFKKDKIQTVQQIRDRRYNEIIRQTNKLVYNIMNKINSSSIEDHLYIRFYDGYNHYYPLTINDSLLDELNHFFNNYGWKLKLDGDFIRIIPNE